MARGRNRKAGQRHPSGKLVQASTGALQREAMATVIAARQRHHGVTARQARDPRLGTALGRLAFAGIITADQHSAGVRYGEIIACHRAVTGLPTDQPRSVTALLINEGIFGGSAPDPDPELIAKVRRRATSAILALGTADREAPGSAGRRPSDLVHAMVCHEAEASMWSAADIASLRHGLDALHRLFRTGRSSL